MIEKVVAIDGPSGSGKSTVAKKVASHLKLLYVDTGAQFRALAAYFHQQGELGPSFNEDKLKDLLMNLKLEYGVSDKILIRVNGEDFTQKIREHQVSEWASQVSKVKIVREFLLSFQRGLAHHGDRICCMEGRDIGTVVFPQAFCKIFLSASLAERTERRLKELRSKGNLDITYEELLKDVADRDYADSHRQEAPLRQAADALAFDTTGLSIEEVVFGIAKYAGEQALLHGFKLD